MEKHSWTKNMAVVDHRLKHAPEEEVRGPLVLQLDDEADNEDGRKQ